MISVVLIMPCLLSQWADLSISETADQEFCSNSKVSGVYTQYCPVSSGNFLLMKEVREN